CCRRRSMQSYFRWKGICRLREIACARASGPSRYCVQNENEVKSSPSRWVGWGHVWVGEPVSEVVDRVPGSLCERKRVRGLPFRASLAGRICLSGLQRRPRVAAEDQSVHL